MQDSISRIFSLIITIVVLFGMMGLINFLGNNIKSKTEELKTSIEEIAASENPNEIIITEELLLETINTEFTETIVVESEIINSESKESVNIQEEFVSDSISPETAEVANTMLHIIKFLIPITIIPLIMMLLINIIKLGMGDRGFSYSSSYSSSSSNSMSFSDFISERKERMLTDKIIFNSILKSGKKMTDSDVEFLQSTIEMKTEWYSFKKQIKEVNKDEKLFANLLLDVLSNLNEIVDYFEENKCENFKDVHNCTFDAYVNDKESYFKINDNYYLKEIVFYVLTNNNIKTIELYKYLSNSNKRADLSCVIANFIEGELSLSEDMSTSNTLEESVKVFNKTYNLNLSLDVAKNLIYLSKINNDKTLENKLLNETSLMDELKGFRHYMYA